MTKVAPLTFPAAVKTIIDGLSPDEKENIRENEPDWGTHHIQGQWLRNNWKLWEKDTPLVKDFKKRYNLWGMADDITGLLFHCVWNEVRGKPWGDKSQVEVYRRHWERCGVDPETGEEK